MSKKLLIVGGAILVLIFIIVGVTYANQSFEIVFNRAEGNEVFKRCNTDIDGKLDDVCISAIENICDSWAVSNLESGSQGQSYTISELRNMVFRSNQNFYCLSGSSHSFSLNCYVCNDDDKIMFWSTETPSDPLCKSGFTKSQSIRTEAACQIKESCYVCNSDSNIRKWGISGESDSNCSLGYSIENIPKNECKNVLFNSQTGVGMTTIAAVLACITLVVSIIFYGRCKV